MVDHEYFELFQKDNTDKQLRIVTDDGLANITNTEIHQQQFELTESLCSENELRFGSCETSMIKFTISNTFIPLDGKWLTVTMIVERHTDKPFQIGRYKVFSDIATADRTKRDVVAYDAMYDIINADASEVAAWYNSVLPEKDDWITMRSFRTSFMRHFGIEQEETELVNDYMKVERTIEPSEMSGLDVITAICEINGCFGHIGRDGKFHYIYLPQAIQGLYPANNLYPDHAPDYLPYQQRTGHLYPQDPKSTRVGADGTYIGHPEYESFLCQSIDKLQIRQEENDIGVIAGREGDNCYIIEDNFLVYGKGSEELQGIADNIFGKITDVIYRPFSAEAKGNPCLEVGDPIRLTTKYDLIESYILQHTLKGVQSLRDAYLADGAEKYSEQVNGVHKSIIQLKGKSNVLERTIEETRLEMTDIEKGLKNEISITAKGLQADITAEKERAEGEEEKLSTSLFITAQGLQASIDREVSRAREEEEKLSNDINITAEGLTADIAQEARRATGKEEDLSNQIKATAEELSVKIKEETTTWDTENYNISYRFPKDPDIVSAEGEYWLNTATGQLFVGKGAEATWTYLDSFQWDRGVSRWRSDKTGQTIWRQYGTHAGYAMQRYGGLEKDPPDRTNYPVGTWWCKYGGTGLSDERIQTMLDDLEVYTGWWSGDVGNNQPVTPMEVYELASIGESKWEYVKTLGTITLSNIQSQFIQLANSFVLKINSNGEIAEVQLSANPDTGTVFKVKADNISLTAEEVINLISGGDFNLTAKNIKISSDNFKVDKNGNVDANNAKFNNVECKNIKAFSIDSNSLDAMESFSSAVDDSESMKLAQKAIKDIDTTVKNLNGTIIPQINTWINQLSSQLRELGKPGIS